MITICAWCRIVLGETSRTPGEDPRPSHGICRRCARELLGEAFVARADSARWPGCQRAAGIAGELEENHDIQSQSRIS